MKWLNGDSLLMMDDIDAESVDCIVTSPPYYRLRPSCGVPGAVGSEKNPLSYVANVSRILTAAKRVLKKSGTMWVNIADSYAGRGSGRNGTRDGMVLPSVGIPSRYKHKDLLGVPFLLAIELQRRGWYWRQVIVWEKPNCVPESVPDRCTNSHEYILLFSKSEKYYFNHEAIKERTTGTTRGKAGSFCRNGSVRKGTTHRDSREDVSYSGEFRRCRSVWRISTQAKKQKHHSTFPPSLPEKCILAGCPDGGTVLDPFAGSGTTGLVAERLGRKGIMIEIDPQFQDEGVLDEMAERT